MNDQSLFSAENSTIDRVVYVVDDDLNVLQSIVFMLESAGFEPIPFFSGQLFLDAGDLRPGCILLDLSMPGVDGGHVVEALAQRGNVMPVIMLTGAGSVDSAVHAMKWGCLDFLQKPIERCIMTASLDAAFIELQRRLRQQAVALEARARIAELPRRERDVLKGLVAGLPNKSIAFDLQISSRTVEIYRSRLMAKLGTDNLSDMLKIAFDAGMD